jgi:hypothetical protein
LEMAEPAACAGEEEGDPVRVGRWEAGDSLPRAEAREKQAK